MGGGSRRGPGSPDVAEGGHFGAQQARTLEDAERVG